MSLQDSRSTFHIVAQRGRDSFSPLQRQNVNLICMADEEVYIFDDFGGWVDERLNYYDKDGAPSGYFDKDYNFYDMRGVRIPGGY
jgi:hypothetical protein